MSFGDKLKNFLGKNEDNKKSKNFKYLDDLIHSGINEIVLDSDIFLGRREDSKYVNGIKLDIDNIVINGNGHIIHGGGKTRIFECTGKNILIKNITLKRGLADIAGAIYNYGELTIEESLLSDNEANGIYGDSDSNGAGAIYNKGTLTITDSTLQENTAKRDGGAIRNKGVLNIKDSIFDDNTATLFTGGAIDNSGKLSIADSTFTGNKAERGGAIGNWGHLTITESSFKGNASNGGEGGAISNGGELLISKSIINNNTASHHIESYGGAIRNAGKLTIKESTINNNKTDVEPTAGTIGKCEGGAIFNDDGELSIIKSTLSGNAATNTRLGSGGSISNTGKLSMKESVLSGNMANKRGGAIYCNTGQIKIFDCEISDNESRHNIILNEDSLEVHNSNFNENKSENVIFNNLSESNLGVFSSKFICNGISKSIISNSGKFCVVEKTVFENNASSKNIINQSDLVLIRPEIDDDSKTIVNNGHILIKNSSQEIEDKIEGDGIIETDAERLPIDERYDFGYLDRIIHESDTKEIILNEDISFEDYEKDFYEGGIELDIDDLVIDGNGHAIDGAGKSRIFIITGNNILLKNIAFKSGHSHKNYDNPSNNNGGAIKINHDNNFTIKNCQFADNISEDCGGAIYNYNGDLSIVESEFSKNTAHSGGAIENDAGALSICKSAFDNNVVEEWGGSITNYGALSITNSIFLKNEVKGKSGKDSGDFDGIINFRYGMGGAIYNIGELTIVESKFESNNAKNDGGAIHSDGEMTIDKSTLKQNTAQKNGGAIFNNGKLSITNSTLTGNTRPKRGGFDSNGGAIFNNGKLSITNSTLTGNTTNHDGGAICHIGSELTITDSTLTGNTADNGGAINNTGKLTITESVLNNNTAKWSGGAIYNTDELTITESTLNNNTSRFDGGAICNRGELSVTDCAFTENTAREKKSGAISVEDYKKYKSDNCTFKDNKPSDVHKH